MKDTLREAGSSLSAFRLVLRKHPRLGSLTRATRALIHFGPWRHAARSYIRKARPPVQPASPPVSIIPDLDAGAVADAVRRDSFCVAGQLPQDLLQEIRELTDQLPPNEYGSFDDQHHVVKQLVTDPGVWAVARSYLGAEPELLECNLVIQEAEKDGKLHPSSQRRFHFDYAGWHSLNLFIYLTDVAPDAGSHQVVAGTHKYKHVRDAIRPSLDDEEVEHRFGAQIRTIAGPAGTMFFEDTEAFHRRVAVRERRVMLNILFASHRSAFSRGRLVKSHRELVASRARQSV